MVQTTNARFAQRTGVRVKYRGVLINRYGTHGHLVSDDIRVPSRYRNGKDSVTKHRDGEKTLNNRAMITGVNLGATRTLELYVDKGVVVRVRIGSGSMYHFGAQLWHGVPKDESVADVRFNLTFREEAPPSVPLSSSSSSSSTGTAPDVDKKRVREEEHEAVSVDESAAHRSKKRRLDGADSD